MNEYSFMSRATTLTPDDVLDAALSTFDSLGYASTRVPAIAERADVAVGSLYRLFPSKEALANALYQREKVRLAEALFGGLDLTAPAKPTFDVIWERLVQFAVSHPDALCFLELHHHDAYLDDASRGLATTLDDQVAEIIRMWQGRAEVRDGDPALLHLQVFGGFVAVVRHLRRHNDLVGTHMDEMTREPAWALLRRT